MPGTDKFMFFHYLNECNVVFYPEQLNDSLKQMDCKYNEVQISRILLNLQHVWPVWAIFKVFALVIDHECILNVMLFSVFPSGLIQTP
jgi:hypothetical protein